jgi:phospholipid/cholesterol/gamma-HCH transport system ATP-binding protein
MDNEMIIEVKGLSSYLDGKPVLRDVSFHANIGETTIILGSSGSGKTTILRHLLGLYPAEGDTISVLGKNPSLLDELEARQFYRQLGVFYQNGALLNSCTVGENIALPLEQHTDLNPEMIEEIVHLKLQLVNLHGTFDLFPSQLSGGMLKRAALARAIVMDPPLLFCDEPGAGLDPVSLAQLDELILSLQQLLGMTVVMITHEVTSILRVADRIVFLEDGTIIFEGPLQKALASSIPAMKEFFSRGKGES